MFQQFTKGKRRQISRNYGNNVNNIGAHLSRKGISTYMIKGYIGGSLQQAMNIRCGWKMAGVMDTYCRYKAAGDQYCGGI